MTQKMMWREQRRDGSFTWNSIGRGEAYYNNAFAMQVMTDYEISLRAEIATLEEEIAKLKSEHQRVTTRNVPPKHQTVADMKRGDTGYCTPWSLKYNADGTVRYIPTYVEISNSPGGTVQAEIKRCWNGKYVVDLSRVDYR